MLERGRQKKKELKPHKLERSFVLPCLTSCLYVAATPTRAFLSFQPLSAEFRFDCPLKLFAEGKGDGGGGRRVGQEELREGEL